MRHNMIRWQVPFMHRFRLSRIYFLLGIHNPRAFCIQTYTILIYSRFRILNYRKSINNKCIETSIGFNVIEYQYESIR